MHFYGESKALKIGLLSMLSASNFEIFITLLLHDSSLTWNADKQEASAHNAAAGASNQLADNDPVDARRQQWWRPRQREEGIE
ncbi:unnamed protein product [Urochloa humidicola]